MYSFFRPLLFRLDPERAHHLTLGLLRWAGQLPITHYLLRSLFEVNDPRLAVEAFGLKFKNPVGLAAGYDKNGAAVNGLMALGFGHVEVGTVTRAPQEGNPRPRVHRVPEARGVINRMGFPNAGINHLLAESLRWQKAPGAHIGINIGKGKDTPLEQAAEDYCALLQQAHGRADYIAINISSPNTVGLRQLQARAALESLLRAIATTRADLTPRVPVLVKIAPDLEESEVDEILMAVLLAGLDGVIATNTTVSRAGLPNYAVALQGGLSGAPVRQRATALIRYIAQRTEGQLPIIGVGGILTPADAQAKLDAGAALVQVYTGLVYAGPSLVGNINRALLKRGA